MRFASEQRRAGAKADTAAAAVADLAARQSRVREMKAPRDGVLVTAPKREDVGKLFDRGFTETQPLFAVGDPGRLIVKVPVTPPNFRVLRDDMAERGELDATIHVQGAERPHVRGKGAAAARSRTRRRCRWP